jgi:CRISPR-associated protein Csx3
MAIRYPAIFIGGPPGSGKSWLVWNINRALRSRKIPCYVLRAHPDGEGNWRYEAPPPTADELRRRAKQGWTPSFAAKIAADIEHRHLPLLVDAGGKISSENQQIMTHCTGAILIARNTADLAPWRTEVQRLNLPLLADLRSIREGEATLDAAGVTVQGSVSGLGRDESASGPCFAELIQRLAGLFQFAPDELYRQHSTLIEREPLHLEQPIGSLPAHSSVGKLWEWQELPTLLATIPNDEPLALYGVGPTWLYAALAAHSRHEPLIFNIALGWVSPPPVLFATEPDRERLLWQLHQAEGVTQISLNVPTLYLDYDEACANPLPIPIIDPSNAVILDGKLPLWLYASLVRAYAPAPWIAISEPRTTPPQAVVIATQAPGLVGTLRPILA